MNWIKDEVQHCYPIPNKKQLNLSNRIFHYTRSITPMRVTSLRRPISASLRPGNTAPFWQMAQRWRAVGNTESNLNGPRFEPQTSRSRDECVTARPTGRFDSSFKFFNMSEQRLCKTFSRFPFLFYMLAVCDTKPHFAAPGAEPELPSGCYVTGYAYGYHRLQSHLTS